MFNGCKGVIFDFNGTLFFDRDKHVLVRNRLSRDLCGVGISPEELQTHFYGVPNNRAIEYLLQRDCDEAELIKYSERKEAYYREVCKADTEKFHLVEGVDEFFAFLKANKSPLQLQVNLSMRILISSWKLFVWISGSALNGSSMMTDLLSTRWRCSDLLLLPLEFQ